MTTATLIRGGRVLDVRSGQSAVRDLLVVDGRVTEPGVSAPENTEVIDVSGAWVAPGFIDLHTHVFDHPMFAHSRLAADRIGVAQGVATVVDAGSSGPVTIDAFRSFVVDTQRTRVRAFVNIGSPGLPGLGGGHASRPELLDPTGVVAALERHSDWLVGVKVLASQSHTGAFGTQAVRIALTAAAAAGVPLMLHIGNAPPTVGEILDLLRPGDIVTHTFHGKHGGVIDRRGALLPEFRSAIDRGVVVDLGHGQSSCSFRVTRQALAAGAPLHSISSDLHRGNLKAPVVSLARTMSKLLAIGLSLNEVIAAVTLTPARAVGLHRQGLGTLEPGANGDITVFDLVEAPTEVQDAEGECLQIREWIRPRGVLRAGHWHTVEAPL